MKKGFQLVCMGLGFLLVFMACEQNNNVRIASKVNLDKSFVSGKIGDNIDVTVSYNPNEIRKLIVTKTLNGVTVPNYNREIALDGTSGSYLFSQMILAGDEQGVLVFTFTGYNASGEKIDASDVVVKVFLSGTPLLLKYDWRMTLQSIEGEDQTTNAMLNNVYRFNDDYSWELDFGADGTLGELLTQNCAWKIAGNESRIDSIFLVKFGFLATTPTIEGWKVLKLENEDLWIETRMDLSWAGMSTEAVVLEKYIAVPKSPNFSPYGNQPAGNYNWGPCTPGEY